MQIYSRAGATQIAADPEPYTADESGAFDVPHELGEQLIDFHGPDGQLFESGGQRNDRLAREDLERRQSPESMYDLMASFLKANTPAETAAPVEKAAKKESAAAKKKREAAEAKAVEVIEGTPTDEEITAENAAVIVDADGVEYVGETGEPSTK
jgi:nucleotide-binding universal stress UspA family protein